MTTDRPDETMSFQLYDTMTRQKQRFQPRTSGEVSIYVCGVTPYDDAHIGHARPSVFFDVVRRFLTSLGWKVTLIQNFTDVDDKIIERANREGTEPMELSRRFSERYLQSMDSLGVARADQYPKVSEHMPEIIEMIQGLIQRGAAYAHGGNVFFSVESFDDYGKLSGQRKEDLIESGRIEHVEGKNDPLDFTLWKAAKPDEPSWDSPWGQGRPGWHIECSAMSLKYLGNGFDIHGGGLDLIFPHHENEIAQSEAYTCDAPFARYWMHNGLINLGDEKMSKSLGNVVSVEELLEDYDASLIRHALLQHHYRSPMEMSAEQMQSIERGWRRLNETYERLLEIGEPIHPDDNEADSADESMKELATKAKAKFDAGMTDDFNTPAAIAALFELVNGVRPYLAQGEKAEEPERTGLRLIAGTIKSLGGDILGIIAPDGVRQSQGAGKTDSRSADGGADELVDGLVQIIIKERARAREQKQWERADGLRDALAELGITLIDTAEGTDWKRNR